jgi:hypothetical protein
MSERIPNFTEFWPFYVSQHRSPFNRALHFVGTTGTNLSVLSALVTLRPSLLILAPLCGYFWAWIGHFFVEKNRPATFTYPVWSLIADYKMYGLMLLGRMNGEVERVSSGAPARAA